MWLVLRWDSDKLKKHETDGLDTAKSESAIKDNDAHSERKLDSWTCEKFVPFYTKQMRVNTQIYKLVQPKETASRNTKSAEEWTNKQIKKLPQAGAKQSLISIIVGAIFTVLAGLGLFKRKKE